MKKHFIRLNLILILILISSYTMAQNGVPSYDQQKIFQLAPPGALKFGMYGFDNPATLRYADHPDFYFTMSDAIGRWDEFNHYGAFFATTNFGAGFIHQKASIGEITDYRLSTSWGDKTMSGGFGVGWSTGATEEYQRTTFATLGTLYRPNEYISFGLVGARSFKNAGSEANADLSVRPFADYELTAFVEYDIQNRQHLAEGEWSVGAVTEFLPGVRIIGRYFNTKAITLGFQLSLGTLGLETQTYYTPDHKYGFNTYGIHIGAYDRNVFDTYLENKKKYVEMNLGGSIAYQKYKYFDNTKTLNSILDEIESAKEDPRVSGIAINASAVDVDREKLWEIREALRAFKASGKHVVIFIDRANIDLYHFASVADRIIMDELGMIEMEGFVAGRTFFKGTLEKLGIGFDEWRFFKYKSAVEPLSRDSMSAPDREQRLAIIREYYDEAKHDICATGRVNETKFDSLVNNEAVFTAQRALELHLVDTLARWNDVSKVITKLEGEDKTFIGPNKTMKRKMPYDAKWSEKPTIAVIYVLGSCAMDEGINARQLVHTVQNAVDNPKIKAIVFRVDSPGGDAMASDYIAEVMRKAKGKKPMIVSQGYVAASGGYWLSMYGDTIVAAPTTITGSIGVIGGFVYNKGLKEMLGLSTDKVQVGNHADLGFGFQLPFFGIGLPDRNMTVDERSRVEIVIRNMYTDFVTKVAQGRNKKYDEIDSIAQGRIWSGTEGKKNGLVDVIGGLETAISIAKEKAGIGKDEEITIVELPEKGIINFSQFMPKMNPFSSSQVENLIDQIKFRSEFNGRPLMMLPFDDMDLVPEEIK